MPQISLYIDDETMTTLRTDAAREGVSISKHVGSIIRERKTRGGYPDGFFALYGCLANSDITRPADGDTRDIDAIFA